MKRPAWPKIFAASARPTPELDRVDEDVATPIGASGTINMAGQIVADEYNPDLKGDRAVDVYERMRRSDASVRETLWHVFAPILNAEWTVEPPPNPSELEQEVTAFVRAAYFEWLNQPFVEYLQQALLYLVFGHALFETQFQVVERGLKVEYTDSSEDPAGAPDLTTLQVSADFPQNGNGQLQLVPQEPIKKARDIPRRQFVCWRKFHPRLPKTIFAWNIDRNDELTSVTQYAAIRQSSGDMMYEKVDIPAAYLVVYTNEKWGAEWTGISLLRSAYKAWVLKEMIEKIAGMAFERYGVGVPVVFMPRAREDDEAAITKAEEMLANMRSGESSYLVFSGPEASGNLDGYTFRIECPDGGIPDFKPFLEYLRGEIAGGLLARFKELGHATTGARATANVQAEVWYNALHAIARYIGDVNAPTIRRLVDLNYDGVERYPRLQASSIEARNILEFAQTVALLANANALAMDSPTRSHVRRTLDFPEEDPEEAEMRAEALTKQAQLEQLSLGGIEPDPAQMARTRVSKSSTTT